MANAQLLLRPSREKKAYRLKCRFKIEPCPSPLRDSMGHARWMARLEREKVRVAERFVRDMHTKSPPWDNLPDYGFKMRGPFPMVVIKPIHVKRMPSAREMLPAVAQGARFLDSGVSGVSDVPKLGESEWWEFEISGIFAREELLAEIPDAHEEERA